MFLKKAIELLAQGLSGPTKQQVKDWFQSHPNPPDEDVHAWAEENGWDPHELEEVIYSVLSDG